MRDFLVKNIPLVLSQIATLLIFVFGRLDISLVIMLFCLIFDYVTGMAVAYKQERINSKIGANGLIKKFCYLVMIASANFIDIMLGNTGEVRTLFTYYLISNELISIFENGAKLGVPIPKLITGKLEQIKTLYEVRDNISISDKIKEIEVDK